MPRQAEVRLSKRTVDGLAVEGADKVFWDRELPRLRGPGLSLGAQGLCGAVPGSGGH